jgi:hypothetical protein
MSLDHILSVQVQQFASLIRLPTEIARPLAPLPKTRFHLQGIHESDAPVYWNVIAESLLVSKCCTSRFSVSMPLYVVKNH